MAKKHTFDYDLIIIGSGAGGSAAATIAAREGKHVAIIEADTFGGDSPNHSDVPTKALLHAAQLYDETRHASRFGLRTSTVGYNYPSLKAWKDTVVGRTGAGGSKRFYESHGITAIQGRAHFLSPHEITVNRRHLSAAQFIIATGASLHIPELPGLDTISFYTPRTLLEVLRPPKSLVVIGGGQTGVELAQLMAIFGTKVTIAEKAARLLPQLDKEVGELLATSLTDQKGMTVLTHTRVVAVQKDGLGVRVTYSRGGVEKHVRADALLLAAGRTPVVDIGLENATVAYSDKGITVNDYLQTSVKHIFAAGDVLGSVASSTHRALLESTTVAHNLYHKPMVMPNYTGLPSIIFTTPNIAHVGLTEDDCTRRDLRVRIGSAPLTIIARSNTSDYTDGFVKLIADSKNVLLGATIVAPHAAEIIHELALAVRHNLTIDQIADTPHGFLSWSEAVRVAANKLT